MHNSRKYGRRSRRLTLPLTLVSLVLIVGILRLAREIVIPISVAILLTFILAPVVSLLQRRGFGRVFAVGITVVFAFALLGAATAVITFQFRGLANELPNYRHNIRKKVSDLRLASKGGSIEKVQDAVKDVLNEINKADPNATNAPPAVPVVVTDEASSTAAPLVKPILSELASAGLVIALVIFMLLQREELRDRLLRLGGYGRLAITTKAVDEAGKLVSSYLLRQCLLNSGFGLGLGVGLYFIGLPYAVLWGFIGALGRFVPYVGPILGAGAPILMSLAVFDSWTVPFLVIALVAGLELINNMLLEPLLYGRTIGVSQVALLIMIAFWTWLWGPIGLLLATPITGCLMVICKNIPGLEFIPLLMGSEPALTPTQVFYQRLVVRDNEEADKVIRSFGQIHSRAELFEQLLIPALLCCRHDWNRRRISEDDQKFIITSIRRLVEPFEEIEPGGGLSPENPSRTSLGLGQSHTDRPLILGYPASDQADEVALLMLAEMLAEDGWKMKVLSSTMLSSEGLAELEKELPAVVCLCVLPEGPLFQARQVCKRLRSQLPQLPLVAGCWGTPRPSAANAVQLFAGMTDAIGYSLAETKNQVIQFAQLQKELPAAI